MVSPFWFGRLMVIPDLPPFRVEVTEKISRHYWICLRQTTAAIGPAAAPGFVRCTAHRHSKKRYNHGKWLFPNDKLINGPGQKVR